MTELADHGFDAGSYRIPRPIDEDAGSMTLIEESLRGKSLYDRLRVDHVKEGREWIVMAARWLAKLHGCRLRLTPSDEFITKEERRLSRYLERFTGIRHQVQRPGRGNSRHYREEELRLAKEESGTFVQVTRLPPEKTFSSARSAPVRGTWRPSTSRVPPSCPSLSTWDVSWRNSAPAHGFTEIRSAYPDDLFLDAYTEAVGGLPDGFVRQVELFGRGSTSALPRTSSRWGWERARTLADSPGDRADAAARGEGAVPVAEGPSGGNHRQMPTTLQGTRHITERARRNTDDQQLNGAVPQQSPERGTLFGAIVSLHVFGGRVMGLKGAANWFMVQYHEEMVHFMKLPPTWGARGSC